MKYSTVFITLFLALSFSSLGLAGEEYKWYIIQGKDGVCKVIHADKKTPASIAGPYKTRENALAAKEEKCGTKRKRSSKRTSGLTT